MRMLACAIVLFSVVATCNADIMSYEELVSSISSALYDKEILRGGAFTNDVGSFALSSTNKLHTLTAELGLALAFHEIASSTGEDSLFEKGLLVITNALQATNCPMTAWQKYAGMAIYCDYLNDNSDYSRSFIVSTNALALIDNHNPVLEEPNFWSALAQYDGTPGASFRQSFQMNAAATLAVSGFSENIQGFTNGLPANIMAPLLELLGDIGN